MAGAFRRGRDRDLGGAFQYSRRGLRLRRRGAYGIHRASGPWCQGLCRKVASLRSGGRRLAVRKTIEYQIGALPCTPFPASRDFAPVGSMSLDSRVAELPYESSSFATSRGNESVTDSPFCVIWHDKHSADWLAALASPYPASPDFPRKRGKNKANA